MKASEWAAPFRYERVGVQWLNTPLSYCNRDAVTQAMRVVGPGWAGLSSGRPSIPAGAQPPSNAMQAVLSGYPTYLLGMLREGD